MILKSRNRNTKLNVHYGGERQLGAGIYTTPGPGQWVPNPDEWYVTTTYAYSLRN
jgi:hypothetical protein